MGRGLVREVRGLGQLHRPRNPRGALLHLLPRGDGEDGPQAVRRLDGPRLRGVEHGPRGGGIPAPRSVDRRRGNDVEHRPLHRRGGDRRDRRIRLWRKRRAARRVQAKA